MSDLRVALPPEMEPYRSDLEYFFATMVRKLHTNRHKGTGVDLNPKDMLKGAHVELCEAKAALHEEGQFEFGVECVDVANFMFLAARAAWHLTREDYEVLREVPKPMHTIGESDD